MRFVNYCIPFYSQFVQCPNFFGIGFVYTHTYTINMLSGNIVCSKVCDKKLGYALQAVQDLHSGVQISINRVIPL